MNARAPGAHVWLCGDLESPAPSPALPGMYRTSELPAVAATTLGSLAFVSAAFPGFYL